MVVCDFCHLLTISLKTCILVKMNDKKTPAAKRRKVPQSLLEQAATVPDEQITALWLLWKGIYAHKLGRQPKLRQRMAEDIAIAIIAYGFETCKRAIIGAYFSPWHMGDNPAGKRYASIQLILRYGDAWRVNKFAKLYNENLEESEALQAEHGILVTAILYPNPTVVEEVVEAK